MLRRTQDPELREFDLTYGAVTLSGWPSQALQLSKLFGNSNVQSYNPKKQASWFGLFPFRSPLLRESNFLSVPVGTEMFQFPTFTFTHPMNSDADNSRLKLLGCPIRKSPDQSLLTAPRGISVLVPSFIGS